MSSSFSFSTPPFTVIAASAIDASTVKVTLSSVPNGFSAANFSIPPTSVVAAVSDPQDPNSVILSVVPPLQVGSYTVTCSGLTSGSPPVAMTGPFNAAFSVSVGPSITPAPQLASPATNNSAFDILRGYIPPSMSGDVWTQLLGTLSDEIQVLWTQAAAVYDQLFLVSAEGQYLDQRASEIGGYSRPEPVGFTDDVFRQLVIQISTRKLTLNSFLALLEIYYGIDATRAHIQTTVPQNFSVPDGSTQSFNFDGVGPFTVTFRSSDFANVSAVSAIEAAIALNRQFALIGAKALALPFVNTQTNQTFLNVYTASRGLRGSVQNISGPLPFPTTKQTVQEQSMAAYVKAVNGNVEVVLPATSLVVTRQPNTNAAYLNGTDLIITFAQIDENTGAVTVETNLPHGVLAGEGFLIEGLTYPPNNGADFTLNGIFQAYSVPSPDTIVFIIPSLLNEVVDNENDIVEDNESDIVVT